MVQLSHQYVTTGKAIALTIWTFVSKVISLLFNTLSRLVKAFLPRSKHLLISWLKSPAAEILEPPKIKPLSFHCSPICDFGAQENKICHSFHFFPFYLPWRDGTRCHDLSFFWMLSYKPALSLSSFTLVRWATLGDWPVLTTLQPPHW